MRHVLKKKSYADRSWQVVEINFKVERSGDPGIPETCEEDEEKIPWKHKTMKKSGYSIEKSMKKREKEREGQR